MHEILAPTDESIKYVADVLVRGGVAAFPTETVYGLGGNAHCDKSISEIFLRKGRPESKPLNICYSSFEKVFDDVEINDRALVLAKKFLPGPLTIVLKRRSSSKLSQLCTGGLETMGVRIPSDPVAAKLLAQLPFPLAAPSANKSACPSSITAQQVSDSLKDNKNLIILDGGPCSIGIESTIVDLVENKIIRIGAISATEIESFL
ncbi:MAG: threonylcarbamoyl-AMP synthase [Holosporaceae bacterium]|jgi:L-threonylcarbamoyladenylate synthase|nr:threonylcarbamoyl-AMP synthase [Holosporaceae bacterium]